MLVHASAAGACKCSLRLFVSVSGCLSVLSVPVHVVSTRKRLFMLLILSVPIGACQCLLVLPLGCDITIEIQKYENIRRMCSLSCSFLWWFQHALIPKIFILKKKSVYRMLKRKYREDPLLYSSCFPSGCFYAQIRVMISKAGKEIHITCSGITSLFLSNAHIPVILSVIKYPTALLFETFPSFSSHCCAHPHVCQSLWPFEIPNLCSISAELSF